MNAQMSATNTSLWRAYRVAFAATVGAAVLLGIVWILQSTGVATGLAGLQGILLWLVIIGGVAMGISYGLLALRGRR